MQPTMNFTTGKNKNWNYLVDSIFFGAVLTSSFDIFLVLDIGGFTVRCTQLFQMALIVLAAFHILRERKLFWPKGYGFLVGFVAVNLLCTFHTILPKWNLAYNAWLILFAAVVWAVTALYAGRAERMLWLYVLSFYVMAIWGCVQFILGFTGISQWMISQWWMEGFPRVNGFTYEPSYYATYMIMGYLFVQVCSLYGKTKIGGLPLRPLQYLSIIAMVFCSSRMAYIPMGMMFVISLGTLAIQAFQDRRVTAKQVKELIRQAGFILVYFIGLNALMQISLIQAQAQMQAQIQPQEQAQMQVEAEMDVDASDILLRNVGANSDYANITTRLDGWKAAWELFMESPLWGYGLGGISAEAMARDGMSLAEMEAFGRGGVTGNVFLEVLAASGLIGAILLLAYGVVLIRPMFSRKIWTGNGDTIALALILALLGEAVMLAMNQNLLRNYTWLHIAVLSGYLYSQRQLPDCEITRQ